MSAERIKTLACAALIALAALAGWGNSLTASFQLDDHPSIEGNLAIRSLGNIAEILKTKPDTSIIGRPLPNITFAVNYALGGNNPRGYHAVNLALHVFAALALFGFLRRALASRPLAATFKEHATPLALCMALLWVSHPMQTAAVTYVVQRVEVLASLFILLALYFFARSVEEPEREGVFSALAVVCAFFGAASKEIAAALPLLTLCYDRTFAAGSFRAAFALRKRFHLALASSWLLILALNLHAGTRGGTVFVASQYGPLEYLRVQAYALLLYIKLALWPAPLVFDYGMVEVPGWGMAAAYALPLLALLAATAWGFWKNHPAWFCGAVFFAVLAPTSSFLPIRDPIFLHRMYLPLAPLIALVVLGAARLIMKGGGEARSPWPVYVVALLLVPALAVATFSRNRAFATERILWTDTLAKSPTSLRAYQSLGFIELDEGRFAEAESLFARSLALKDTDFRTLRGLGIAQANLGRFGEAFKNFDAAREKNPADPFTAFEYALALLYYGDRENAAALLRETAENPATGWALALPMARRVRQDGFPTAAVEFAAQAREAALASGELRGAAELTRFLEETTGGGR